MAEESEHNYLDEYEKSAVMFSQLYKLFRKSVYELAAKKKKAPVRVLEAMLFRPLEEVTLYGKDEEKLLDVCSQIIYHKSKLIEYAHRRKEGDFNERK